MLLNGLVWWKLICLSEGVSRGRGKLICLSEGVSRGREAYMSL